MSLYLGNGEKVSIRLIDGIHYLNIPDIISTHDKTTLYSLDNYTLMSSDGYKLVAKEEEAM